MIKSFAISTVTAAFITAASAQPQTAEPHKMDAVFANTATIMVAQAEQDVCPEDKKVGELTKEQREACLGAAAPQPDPFVVRLHGGVNEVSARKLLKIYWNSQKKTQIERLCSTLTHWAVMLIKRPLFTTL